MIRRDPHLFEIDRTRWRLRDVLAVCDWLHVTTEGSLSRLLDRLEISYQRGRDHIHSPDPHYDAKLAHVDRIVAEARASAGRVVALFQDELTYYRQPTLAYAYAERGEGQPHAERQPCKNTSTRAAATLNVLDGRVHYWQGSRFGIPQVVKFYQQCHGRW